MTERADLTIPPALTRAFPPATDALLDLLRARIDDEMLEDISRADYGEDAENHLRVLRGIRDSGRIPAYRMC